MRRVWQALVVAVGAFVGMLAGTPQPAHPAEPIKIGFSMPLTGAIAANGKAALLTIQIWAEEVNAKGGLLGRPVRLVHYDDQSNPSNVPAIYAKLLDVDKVDLIVSSYGTGMMTPVIPIAMQRGLTVIGMLGLSPNEQFKYDRFFQIGPNGPTPKVDLARGMFEVASKQNPKPATIAITGADLEFGKLATDGARQLAKEYSLRVVYDRLYPPTIADLTPVVRAISATRPDLLFVGSYPIDTVGFLRTMHEQKFAPKMIGGAMVGTQYAAIRAQLGPLLNNVVNYEYYVPERTMDFPGIKAFLAKYQAKAAGEGVDQLGFYVPPIIFAGMQVLETAVRKVGKIDHAAIAKVLREDELDTVIGKVKFGPGGEWAQARVLLVQYRNIVGNGIEQFKNEGTQVILYPPSLKSGDPVYPYAAGAN